MTITIQLTAAGADTGSFSIFSNLNLVTPIVTGISKSSLISGYPVIVPDAATSVIVKSNSTHCTNQVTIPITGIITTTTTTTLACITVSYGYDSSDPVTACSNYNNSPVDYYWNGTTLFTNPDCSGIADSGYYSNGTISSYWDGVSLNYDSDCPTTAEITIQARRIGSIKPQNNKVKIVYSFDYGVTWTTIGTGVDPLTGSFSTIGIINAPIDFNVLWIGVLKGGFVTDINATFAEGSTSTAYYYCGNINPPFDIIVGDPGCYNYGPVYLNDTIYLTLPTSNNAYVGC